MLCPSRVNGSVLGSAQEEGIDSGSPLHQDSAHNAKGQLQTHEDSLRRSKSSRCFSRLSKKRCSFALTLRQSLACCKDSNLYRAFAVVSLQFLLALLFSCAAIFLRCTS